MCSLLSKHDTDKQTSINHNFKRYIVFVKNYRYSDFLFIAKLTMTEYKYYIGSGHSTKDGTSVKFTATKQKMLP